jgi:hypothetical protein
MPSSMIVAETAGGAGTAVFVAERLTRTHPQHEHERLVEMARA